MNTKISEGVPNGGHIHNLSYLLKTDDRGNYVAVVHQLPAVVVQGTLENIHQKVERATYNHIHTFENEHERIGNDTSSKLTDTSFGNTIAEAKEFKITC